MVVAWWGLPGAGRPWNHKDIFEGVSRMVIITAFSDVQAQYAVCKGSNGSGF